ncbi:MAG: hypothetical protein RMN52_02680 [Anaerolineae bacterium]|nr:hypothetical protein [Candidatus Roseilinea sp.]MDW8448885.1 hypothetical protein [Anaerolineae bacterium]
MDYVLVGGIALLQYVEGRSTEDLDLIVAVSDLAKLPEYALASAASTSHTGRSAACRLTSGSRAISCSTACARGTRRSGALSSDVPCTTVEGLLLLKLYALPLLYRQGDFTRVNLYEADIAALMQAYRPEMPPLFSALSKHLSESDLREVRSIVSDIQARIARFERGAGGQKRDSSGA